jgi:hypothetical protein
MHNTTAHNLGILHIMILRGKPQKKDIQHLYKSGAIDPHNLDAVFLWA